MTPTRTALALALTAAALVFGAPAAQAEECGFADPSVPGGWVATDCFTNDPEGQRIPEDHPGFREDPESYEEDYAPQLPEETNGRQIDCPDGSVGRQEGDMVICPAPTAADPAAQSTAPIEDRIGDAGGDASVTVDTGTNTAPTAAAPAVTAEGLAEWIRSILWTCFRWLFFGAAR